MKVNTFIKRLTTTRRRRRIAAFASPDYRSFPGVNPQDRRARANVLVACGLDEAKSLDSKDNRYPGQLTQNQPTQLVSNDNEKKVSAANQILSARVSDNSKHHYERIFLLNKFATISHVSYRYPIIDICLGCISR